MHTHEGCTGRSRKREHAIEAARQLSTTRLHAHSIALCSRSYTKCNENAIKKASFRFGHLNHCYGDVPASSQYEISHNGSIGHCTDGHLHEWPDGSKALKHLSAELRTREARMSAKK
eukprot:6180772-Pleurochrysis_carterae.AAC.4